MDGESERSHTISCFPRGKGMLLSTVPGTNGVLSNSEARQEGRMGGWNGNSHRQRTLLQGSSMSGTKPTLHYIVPTSTLRGVLGKRQLGSVGPSKRAALFFLVFFPCWWCSFPCASCARSLSHHVGERQSRCEAHERCRPPSPQIYHRSVGYPILTLALSSSRGLDSRDGRWRPPQSTHCRHHPPSWVL